MLPKQFLTSTISLIEHYFITGRTDMAEAVAELYAAMSKHERVIGEAEYLMELAQEVNDKGNEVLDEMGKN